MKIGCFVFALVAFLALPANCLAGEFWYDATVVSVLDGDTVKVKILAWPEPLQLVSVRIDGIDTPEKGFRAKCKKEAMLGE